MSWKRKSGDQGLLLVPSVAESRMRTNRDNVCTRSRALPRLADARPDAVLPVLVAQAAQGRALDVLLCAAEAATAGHDARADADRADHPHIGSEDAIDEDQERGPDQMFPVFV